MRRKNESETEWLVCQCETIDREIETGEPVVTHDEGQPLRHRPSMAGVRLKILSTMYSPASGYFARMAKSQ